MNDMSPVTRTIVQILIITWTLLIHCGTGDNFVNMRQQKGLPAPSVLDNHQGTGMGRASHLQSDQRNQSDHQGVRRTSNNVTNGANSSFGEREVSTVPYAEDDTPFTSQYSTCDPKKEAMLISICPATAEEEDRTMCQSDEAPPTVDAIFPVTDSVSGYHFRNFYCWRCFNQSGEPLIWSGELFHTFRIMPKNYSSLSSILSYLDENPAFVTWKPPSQFWYPKCENVGSSRCTVCVPNETEINGCSLLGRPQLRAEKSTHTCYACTNFQAQNNLDDIQLCEDVHPENVTYVCNWLNFFFLSWNRSNKLIIEHMPEKACDAKWWASLECSADLGTCSETACRDNSLFLDGKCDIYLSWFFHRYTLCQLKTGEEGCSRQRPRNLLDQQFRNVKEKAINTTTLDMFEVESDSCRYETSEGRELNSSDSATLRDILTTPINRLILLSEQTDDLIYLQVNITEKNDFDSIQIEVSGWGNRLNDAVRIMSWRLRSIIIQTMMTAGVKGNHFLCDRYKLDPSAKGSLSCQVVIICPRKLQEKSDQKNQPLPSVAGRIKIAGLASSLWITLVRLMLY